VLAAFLHVGLEDLTSTLRIIAFVAPVVVGVVAYRLAIERRRRDERELSPIDRLEAAAGDSPQLPAGPFGEDAR
jgi:hypothetical protein